LPKYQLLYHPMVLSRDIPHLNPATRKQVQAAIERKLTEHPEASAKPLAYTTRRLWSLRVGDWRVIFALRETDIWILKIGAPARSVRRARVSGAAGRPLSAEA